MNRLGLLRPEILGKPRAEPFLGLLIPGSSVPSLPPDMLMWIREISLLWLIALLSRCSNSFPMEHIACGAGRDVSVCNSAKTNPNIHHHHITCDDGCW